MRLQHGRDHDRAHLSSCIRDDVGNAKAQQPARSGNHKFVAPARDATDGRIACVDGNLIEPIAVFVEHDNVGASAEVPPVNSRQQQSVIRIGAQRDRAETWPYHPNRQAELGGSPVLMEPAQSWTLLAGQHNKLTGAFQEGKFLPARNTGNLDVFECAAVTVEMKDVQGWRVFPRTLHQRENRFAAPAREISNLRRRHYNAYKVRQRFQFVTMERFNWIDCPKISERCDHAGRGCDRCRRTKLFRCGVVGIVCGDGASFCGFFAVRGESLQATGVVTPEGHAAWRDGRPMCAGGFVEYRIAVIGCERPETGNLARCIPVCFRGEARVPLRVGSKLVALQRRFVHAAPPGRTTVMEAPACASFHFGRPLRGTRISFASGSVPWTSLRSTIRATPSTPRIHAATSRLATGIPGRRGTVPSPGSTRASFCLSVLRTLSLTFLWSRPASASTVAV